MLIQNWLVLSSKKRDKEDSALMWKILPPVWKMLLTFRGGWGWDLLRLRLVWSPPPHTNLTSLYDKKNQLVIKTKWFSGIGVCSATAFQYWFQFQQINLCRRRRVSAVTGVRDSRQKASYGLIRRLIPSFTTQYAAAKKNPKLSVKMSFPRNLSPSHPVKYWLIFFRSSEGGCGA